MGRPAIRIFLGDLRHATAGRHSFFMPLGIGMIGAAVQAALGADRVKVFLFDDPELLLAAFDQNPPDILGLTHYCWNNALSQLVFDYAKFAKPDLICVGGGPDCPLDSREEWAAYLTERQNIDIFVIGEGEMTFTQIANDVLSGMDARSLRDSPRQGCAALRTGSADLMMGAPVVRLVDLDQLPSPYLAGLLDDWFDGRFAPMIETTRGCPYSCGYCVQGEDAWKAVARFSPDRLKRELSYIADRMRLYPNILLSITDANFGMYKQDEEFAEHVAQLRESHGWPNSFNVTTGKSNYDRILRIAERLGNRMDISSSVQSMNEPTLTVIGRRNLPHDQYTELQNEIIRRGMRSAAEMIIPLPNETKTSYFEGLRKLSETGIEFIITHTTIILRGTKLAMKDMREKFGMLSRFRLVPRQFGTYRGHTCFEIEEVCAATNTMSFEDYVDCRGHALVFSVFSLDQYDILLRLAEEMQIQRFDFFFALWDRIRQGNTPLSPLYKSYLEETRSELYETPAQAVAALSHPEAYRKLLEGELGDNLMRSARAKLLVRYGRDSIDLAFDTLIRLASPTGNKLEALQAARQWMLATRDFEAVIEDPVYRRNSYDLDLSFDVPNWYVQTKEQAKPLSDFHRPCRYRVFLDAENIEKQLNEQRALHGNDSVYLAARLINNCPVSDFWRQWAPIP